MAADDNVCAALTLAIILVLILIVVISKDIKSIKGGSETFVNEQEKLNRANDVVATIGPAMQSNPGLSFNESKGLMPSLDAVEYKDIKNNPGTSAANLASKW